MKTLRTKLSVLAASVVAVGALSVGLATSAQAAVAIAPSSPTYVAPVSGTSAFIAIVKGDGEARAYVCDGEGVSAWFSGPTTKGAFVASSESFQLNATLTSRRAKGQVIFPDGTTHNFNAALAPRTGKAGLYRGQTTIGGSTYVGGWIVLPNGGVRGYVEQDNLGVPFTPTGSGIIAILIGRRAVELPGVGSLSIVDGTSNTRR